MRRLVAACLLVLFCSTVLFAAWTTPRTWVTGEVVTAAIMNTHIRDNLDELRAGGIAISSQAAGDFIYAASSTQLGRVSGQLAFPAAQNASANGNTLDDYEEGVWTPVIGGDGGTTGQAYAAQSGTYTKVGRQVSAWFDVDLSTEGTITGNAVISGLPFTSGGSVSCTVGYWENLNASTNAVMAHAGSGVTHAGLYTGGTTVTAMTATNITNTTRFAGVCHFHV